MAKKSGKTGAKPKVPKVSVSDEEAIVLDFMTKENRPFSVVNVVDSLQRQGVKKTGAERALASLVSQGVIHKKEYGKSNIFIIAQDKLELPDAEETAALDEEVKQLTARTAELDEALGALRSRVAQLGATLSLEEAKTELERLTYVAKEKEEKLERLGDGSALLSKEDKLRVETKYFAMLSAWKARKKMVKNIADTIGESSGMKPAELYEKFGVEVDEEVGVNIADYPQIDNPAKRKRQRGPGAKRQKT